jgi:hypothetical protein
VRAPGHQVLEAARSQAGMTLDELWWAYFSLGGTALPNAVQSYLDGSDGRAIDYDVLAQAINERFLDLGGDHPVPYADELT